MRILNSDGTSLNIDQLGLEPFQKEMLLEAINRPYGMVLVTGPTGSGKTVSRLYLPEYFEHGRCEYFNGRRSGRD